nr:hypothetical protein BaRGS_030121 [Batillaria attramentaria]
MLETFSVNLLGSVAGMHLFRHFFRNTNDRALRESLLKEIRRLYLDPEAFGYVSGGELLRDVLVSGSKLEMEETTKSVEPEEEEPRYVEDNVLFTAGTLANITRVALTEMTMRREEMEHMTRLLMHYVFGKRDMEKEHPVTDS